MLINDLKDTDAARGARPLRIALLVGSQRVGSINRCLARAIEACLSPSSTFFEVDMGALPFYNGDLEGERPQEVNKFTQSIRDADAVCIVSPEYNRSIPGVLKNAIDWGSKPKGENVWSGKPVIMAGASPGGIGTAVGQQHLRQILAILGAHVMPGEFYISFKSADLIDDFGTVNDPAVRDFIAAFARQLEDYVRHWA